MAKSPLGRIEMLATQFKADKETIIQLILGENATLITHGLRPNVVDNH